MRVPSLLQRSSWEREKLAADIARRLDRPMTVLGVIFLLVVIAEALLPPGSALAGPLAVTSWLLWGAFALEFLVRMLVAPSATRFLRRNWWQIIFLALPFLRFLRVVRVFRVARVGRVGRVLSAAVRGTRTAGRRLTNRIAWLAAVTVIVIFAGSQLLYVLGAYDDYVAALHDTTMSTIAGVPLTSREPVARVAEILLVTFSVVVFATLAGSVGAFLIEQRSREDAGAVDGPGEDRRG